MEEDIEKIERFILLSEKTFGEATEFAFALRRIKDRYRELEKCLEVTSKSLNNVAYDQIPLAIQDLKVSSISKSKIKEKIEKLVEKNSKEPKGTMRDYLDNEVIKILQELMGDK